MIFIAFSLLVVNKGALSIMNGTSIVDVTDGQLMSNEKHDSMMRIANQ